MCVAMRDFAVAAALAAQPFGPRAVPGVHDLVTLLGGSAGPAAGAHRSKLTRMTDDRHFGG